MQRICKCDLTGDQRLILYSFAEAFSIRLTYALSPSDIAEYPVDTQRCDNVDVRSRRHATSTQHCSNVGVTKLKLQRYSNVASTFDSSFSSQYTVDVVLKALLLQRWNQDVEINSFTDIVNIQLCISRVLPQIYKKYICLILRVDIPSSNSGQCFSLLLESFESCFQKS